MSVLLKAFLVGSILSIFGTGCTSNNQLGSTLNGSSGNSSSSVTPSPTSNPTANPTANPTPITGPPPTANPTPITDPLPTAVPHATPTPAPTGPVATISWGNTYQTIQGFGGSNHAVGKDLNSNDNFFFSTLGYSLLRTGTPEGNTSCLTVSAACATSGDSITDMQACVANGCQVWATSWSPPAVYKTNNSVDCTNSPGNGTLISADYGLFATYLSNYIASLKTYYNITLYAISPQNEPTICEDYDSSVMSASDLDSFIKNNLGPTLKANGQSGTKIMLPESPGFYNYDSLTATCMGDAACAAFIGINAFHGYDNSFSISNPFSSLNLPFWETEVSSGSTFGPSASGCAGGVWCPGITDAMMWANIIDYNIAVVGENAWSFWWLVGANDDNEGIINGNGGPISIRAYVIGNYAKFIRPGFVRIGATHAPQSNVTVSAYKGPSTSFAIVATNQNTSSVNQTFVLSGFSPTSVTPTITSATQSLVSLPSVPVSGSQFSFTLPAQSVVTFH